MPFSATFHKPAKLFPCVEPGHARGSRALQSTYTLPHVSLTVHYPHHPFYGQTVTVVRRPVSFGPHHVQVALSSGYQLVIPDWMLDEERCRGMDVVAPSNRGVVGAYGASLTSRCTIACLFCPRSGSFRSIFIRRCS